MLQAVEQHCTIGQFTKQHVFAEKPESIGYCAQMAAWLWLLLLLRAELEAGDADYSLLGGSFHGSGSLSACTLQVHAKTTPCQLPPMPALKLQAMPTGMIQCIGKGLSGLPDCSIHIPSLHSWQGRRVAGSFPGRWALHRGMLRVTIFVATRCCMMHAAEGCDQFLQLRPTFAPGISRQPASPKRYAALPRCVHLFPRTPAGQHHLRERSVYKARHSALSERLK